MFDALMVHSRTGKDHQSQPDETGGTVVITHLDHVINVQNAHEEIHVRLDWLTKISIGIKNVELLIWWAALDIHQSDILLQMMRMTNRAILVIGLQPCGNDVRAVELCSIWQGKFSLALHKIEFVRRLEDFDSTWQGMTHDGKFSPFKDFILGVQERRVQPEHGDQTITIRGLQRQYGGSSQRSARYAGIILFDNLVFHTDEMASLRFQEFTPGMHRIGCWEERSSEESTELLQPRIAWFIASSQGDSCKNTLQINAMGGVCFTSYRLV